MAACMVADMTGPRAWRDETDGEDAVAGLLPGIARVGQLPGIAPVSLS